MSGSGAESGCEKNWLEREREIAERGMEWGAGVTEICLSDERKFCRSRSAHMLSINSLLTYLLLNGCSYGSCCYRQHCAQRNAPVFIIISYSEADFEVFGYRKPTQ